MRTLAIDPGERRVGLALSDAGAKLATPYDVLEVSSLEESLARIAKLVQDEDIERIVIGLPLNMDGSIGPAARKVLDWGRRLAAATKAPVAFVDERLSSFAAEQQLAARRRAGEKLTRQRKRRQLDAVAAAMLLQEFLDGRLPPIQVQDESGRSNE